MATLDDIVVQRFTKVVKYNTISLFLARYKIQRESFSNFIVGTYVHFNLLDNNCEIGNIAKVIF